MKTSTQYGHVTVTALRFEDAVDAVKASLSENGFGVVSEIDLSKTLRERLGVDIQRTLILGSCNPGFAHEALSAEPGVALFLPCNVVIRELGEAREVSAVDARAMLGFLRNPALESTAARVDDLLSSAIASIPA